jgi:hypothetical protein
MKNYTTNSKSEIKKMEKDALIVFISCSGLVFAAAMCYAYATGNMLCFGILVGVVIFLAVFLGMIFRQKK